MKKFILLLVFIVPVISFSQELTTNPTDCTQAFFKSMLNEDPAIMSKILTDDAMITNFDGFVAEKDLLIQGLGGGYVVIETGATSNLKTRSYNDHAAIVTGSWKAKGNIQGNAFDNEVIFTIVCVKNLGSWQVANIQFTPLK